MITSTQNQYYGQYGNVIQNAKTNALVRGTGAFNPPPNYPQNTNRGDSYKDALNYYLNHGYKLQKGNFGNVKPQNQSEEIQLAEFRYSPIVPVNEFDRDNILPYSVGNTGFHPQQPNSWNTPNADGISDEYTTWALRSVQQDPNSLLNYFFNKENIKYLQKRIVDEVYRIKKVQISQQSTDELLIIMRNHYMRALSGYLPQQNNPNDPQPRGEASCSLENRLSRLNKSVLEESVKQILSGIDMYQEYYKQASSLPMPLSRPIKTTMKGSRVLQENVGFDSGHDYTRAADSYNMRYNII